MVMKIFSILFLLFIRYFFSVVLELLTISFFFQTSFLHMLCFVILLDDFISYFWGNSVDYYLVRILIFLNLSCWGNWIILHMGLSFWWLPYSWIIFLSHISVYNLLLIFLHFLQRYLIFLRLLQIFPLFPTTHNNFP